MTHPQMAADPTFMLSKNREPENVVIIWDRMGDYHRARWNSIRSIYKEGAIFAADLGTTDRLYDWKNTGSEPGYFCLSDYPVEQKALFVRTRNFFKLLSDHHIKTVILAGYGRLEYLGFIILSTITGKKIILFAESWYKRPAFIDIIKSIFLRIFIDGLFVSGTRAKEHFVNRMRFPVSCIITGYSSIDNNHFAVSGNSMQMNQDHDTFSKLKPYLLCVARYSQEKNLDYLIDEYRKSILFKEWKLILIGEGPERKKLGNLIGVDKDWIILSGWKSYEELPAWYQNAQLFILPSVFEPWGLAVNEALSAGLNVFVSKQCGCCDDLVNENEFKFDPYNQGELAALLDKYYLIQTKEKRLRFNEPEIIGKFNLSAWAQNLQKLMNTI